ITQLVIDVSNRPTTRTCVECGMSYVLGVKEDDELHRKHHKWLIGRLEWPIDVETDTCSKVVWRDMNSLNSDRIIKLALDPQSLKRAKYKCRVEQLLEMVNFSLGAQELSIDQLQFSNLYIYLTESPPSISPSSKKRKLNYSSSNIKKKKAVVAAVCIAGRVDFAYQVVKRGNSDGDKNSDKAIDFFTGNGGEEDNLLKIYDSGLYCSPDPQKVYIGIHRIWTSHDYRRLGFARRLLDSISKTFIYAVPLVDNEVRRKFIAFSQPTESGVKLATGWLKNPNFKVYIE
ncbi:ESCO1/2 acetyl-transferase-domain-containing protein, partial [Phakopsora pachyrhizi]